MAERVYLPLNIGDEKTEQAVATLRRQPGVIMADALEERASIIALVEAENRPRLARLAVEALAFVETMTENLSLMPVKEEAKGGSKYSLYSAGGKDSA